MIVRYSGGILGMLAFAVTVLAGLWVGNPFTVTLSRAIWALCVFCVIGLAVGWAAQYVIDDYARRRYDEVVKKPDAEPSPEEVVEVASSVENNSTEVQSEPMGT
jgi:4-hydroxybenzoate polyprenyltransferase